MKHFFLATLISYVIYYLNRKALEFTLFLQGNPKQPSGLFPNLFSVFMIVGWGTFYIHLTIFLALVVKTYLL